MKKIIGFLIVFGVLSANAATNVSCKLEGSNSGLISEITGDVTTQSGLFLVYSAENFNLQIKFEVFGENGHLVNMRAPGITSGFSQVSSDYKQGYVGVWTDENILFSCKVN